MVFREGFGEDVAGHRHRAARAQRLLDVGHVDRPAEAARLETDAEGPEFERGVEFAAHELLGDQRRRAIGRAGGLGEILTLLQRGRLDHQPALVERPAGDAERAAGEIGERVNGRVLRRHDRAERGRIRREHEPVAERALARHPQPVGDDQVGLPALQRDLAGFGGGELCRLNVEVFRLVEAERLHRRDLPGDRAGLLHGQADRVRRLGASRREEGDHSDERRDDGVGRGAPARAPPI